MRSRLKHLRKPLLQQRFFPLSAPIEQTLGMLRNATVLQSLIQKGMQTEDRALLESLHPIFERLVRLFPLPKEDDDVQDDDMTDFHKCRLSIYFGRSKGNGPSGCSINAQICPRCHSGEDRAVFCPAVESP